MPLDLLVELYSRRVLTILFNNCTTEWVLMESGVLQGNPLATLLFNLCLAPLFFHTQVSLLAKVSLVKAYIRPCFLYHVLLSFVFLEELEAYQRVEDWFLATLVASFNAVARGCPSSVAQRAHP